MYNYPMPHSLNSASAIIKIQFLNDECA